VSDPGGELLATLGEDSCDVLIAGAGPAGADLARRLAQAGASVLLVDSLVDLRQAAFSSAALPWAAVQEQALPDAVVAARWSGWTLLGPGSDRRSWTSATPAANAAGTAAAEESVPPLGAVLDFGALRHCLGVLLDCDPAQLLLDVGPHGKPALRRGIGAGAAAVPQFNVAHAGDCILLALHPRRAVGVDVEQQRPGLNWPAIAARMMPARTTSRKNEASRSHSCAVGKARIPPGAGMPIASTSFCVIDVVAAQVQFVVNRILSKSSNIPGDRSSRPPPR
jgi:hypothetical protein